MSAKDTTLPRARREATIPTELGLAVLSSPDGQHGRLRRLSPRGLTIGRGEGDAATRWTFEDPMASRDHAEVSWDAQREAFVIEDRGSRNGTQLDGHDVARECLASSNLIRMGDTLLRVVELDPELELDWRAPEDSPLCGRSAALQRIHRDVARMAESDLTVLVEGETGTGKELVARELHRRSGRAGAYVPINCAAIVGSLVESELFGHVEGAFSGATRAKDGVFVEADGGTLLLDEIGELPAEAQAKLLRVLEERVVRPVGGSPRREIDVRIVCATNRSLAGEVRSGRFRADLFARIHQLHLVMPPLRERPEDILPILSRVVPDARVSADALEAMALHAWPFNVRELVALVRKIQVHARGAMIELEHLRGDLDVGPSDPPTPGALPPQPPPGGGEPTRSELVAALEHFSGRVSEVARHFGRGRTQLYRWMKKHDIDPASFRSVGA